MQGNTVTATTEYLLGGDFCAENGETLQQFRAALITSEYFAESGIVTSEMKQFENCNSYVLLSEYGYNYVVWINSIENTAYLTEQSILIYTDAVSISQNDKEWISVPLPFYDFAKFTTIEKDVVYEDEKFVCLWERSDFDSMCLSSGVSGDYYSLKEFYSTVNDKYVVGFEDETKTIKLRFCRGGLMHKPDLFVGATLTCGENIILEIDTAQLK